ncbi:hypothetical protein [Paenibacillus pabuli]|jgi:hypothetical protein|uniref:hypothetical protein n=1 Tax=Paenibacillus pabuli TaxID=1472 RepID=UPI0007852454|nr:hypothetical protein [Paenibacillus pabuli]MEC0126529.1 hypothetical protein [Paenibacillus pabuli]
MKQINSKAMTLISVIIITIILIGLILMVVSITKLFMSIEKELAAAIVATTGTILVSVFSVIYTKYLEKKRKIEQELRDKKLPMYELFVNYWFDLMYKKKLTGEPMTEQEMVAFFKEFTQGLLVWGSDGVISKWSDFRVKMVSNREGFNENFFFEFEELLLEIRKDTGHKNLKISRGDLLGLFINDIDKYKNR